MSKNLKIFRNVYVVITVFKPRIIMAMQTKLYLIFKCFVEIVFTLKIDQGWAFKHSNFYRIFLNLFEILQYIEKTVKGWF